MPTIAKLYHLCDYCAQDFATCQSHPKFINQHPQFFPIYDGDQHIHHADLIYECPAFDRSYVLDGTKLIYGHLFGNCCGCFVKCPQGAICNECGQIYPIDEIVRRNS
jgi:hypothetical protein